MTHPDDPTTPPSDESSSDAPGPERSPVSAWYDLRDGDPFAPAGTPSADSPPAGTPPTPYSAHTATYQQPPPRNGWKIATIVLSVILGFVALGLGGLVAVGIYFATQELTSPGLDDAVASSCEDLAQAAWRLEPLAAPDEAGDALVDMADAARAVAEDAEAAASGSSADRRFVAAANDLADALQELADDPTEPFDVPTRDGTPVTVVMSEGTPTCPVPPVVTGLDPDAGDDLVVTEGGDF